MMPAFSELSLVRLKTCHPELQLLFNTVIQEFDCTILEGHRGRDAQNAAVKAGNSKLIWPNGKHNSDPSMAVDAAPYPVDWSNNNRFFWFGGYVLGIADSLYRAGLMTHRTLFGGDWNRNYIIDDEKGFRDLVHFELIKK